jgi:putative FmdB family regulatory protein
MPTYDYLCEACDHEFEAFHSMSAAPIKVCPSCKKKKVVRKIGTGAGIIFKGGGFYETDYRNESYKKAADADKAPAAESKPASTDAKPESKAESKAEPKSELKSDPKPAEPKPQAASKSAPKPRSTPKKK